jgi:hypothetical protein
MKRYKSALIFEHWTGVSWRANATVHRAAGNDFPFQNRAARGSVCNGLFADHSDWTAMGSPPYGNIVIEVRPPPLRLQSTWMPLLAADLTS